MARLIFVEGRAHDAEGDVNVLYALFHHLLGDFMRLRNCTEEAAIAEMEKITTTPLLLRKFNFGKYRGRSIGEIAATERAYLQWLLGQKLDSGENDENWIYTLRHYLTQKQRKIKTQYHFSLDILSPLQSSL